MKFLKGLLITLLVLFIIYCIAMFFLPSRYVLERKITVEAPAEEVYNTVVDVETWENWSYWSTMDSTNEMSYFGTAGEVGYGYSWIGDVTGEGTYTISSLEPYERIDYDMFFKGQGDSKGYWNFEPLNDSETRVTYAFIAEFGFFDRIGKFFIDMGLGMPFEESLQALKLYIESGENPNAQVMEIPDYDIQQLSVSAMPYYGIRKAVAISEMSSSFFQDNFQALSVYLGDDMQSMTMPPFAIYEKWEPKTDETVVIVAVACSSSKPETENIKIGKTYEGQVLKINYYGAYEKSEMAHIAMDRHLTENNIEMNGSPYEVYVTDPSTEPDTTLWLTEVYYPIQANQTEASL